MCLNVSGLFVYLVFIIRHIPQDIINIAIQNETKCVQRFCADSFAVFHPVQRIGGNSLLINQVIFCNAFAEQRLIERFIRNHTHHRYHCSIVN